MVAGHQRWPRTTPVNLQARLWLAQCGVGCSDDIYVASISFGATRNYTFAVLAGASTYSILYPPESAPVAVTD